ncbi:MULTISPECIES: DUF4296 domain-containing protein [Capnocytophaga]|uniref:DUF4296 domain-containing protein n=1 Tax=Capnocytophaga canis TaxID=1848903 RepID=A0A0B7I1B2_9FLAO|nr:MULTISPECIES: DUF4296 domain-containing protein [Capnocytophaga]ATA73297.1 hypothetical protein CGC49_08435 [Capnocytophaga sp. H4358]ATA75446.1 hypothetical protein CGC52_08480 [Capnocytophaga sp. H2931]RIY38175.1 DUF4296 domain-containing protein [Capnocytophaga canis]CEN43558.1 conserved exported hypothetical protein [Capnocytophaga canis]CEN49720.1 conserved exported hypothetical protein [Capnocytophaga canis]
MKIRLYILIILCFSVLSCGENIVKKPQKFLSEREMQNLMYDLILLDAIKSTDYTMMDTLNISFQELIYKKYEIDSLILAQNMEYYASFPQKYDTIIKNVELRLKRERDSIIPEIDATSVTPLEVD